MPSSGFLGGGIGPTAIKRRSGLAAPVPVVGAELLVNGEFTSSTTGWNIVLGNASVVDSTSEPGASSSGLDNNCLRLESTASGTSASRNISTSAGDWILLSARAYAKSANTQVRAARLQPTNSTPALTSQVTAEDTWETLRQTVRATNTVGYTLQCQNAGASTSGDIAYFDAGSARTITISSLFSTRLYASANCDLSAAITRTAGTQAGFVARLDSATSPANFIIAYLDGAGNVKVDKCVAGTYTNVISGAITYGSTKILRLVCSGNSVSAYYDGTQVGSTVTVSDAGIVSNTRHGLFSTYASNSFAGYVAA